MRFLKKRTGQTAASAAVAVVLLIVVAAGLMDGLNLLSTRQRCLEVATAAALRGASRGRDYASYVAAGQLWLDAAQAQTEAQAAADAGLSGLALTGYTVRVEVLPAPGGGSIGDFPPGRTWTAAEPSVGVYLAAPVDVVLMRWINGGGPVTIHAFAAAGVVEQ